MSESEQRERFEAWIISDVNGSGADLDHDENDVYEVYATQLAWLAWQESARQSAPAIYPSPFREPFTNAVSGMGIKKP